MISGPSYNVPGPEILSEQMLASKSTAYIIGQRLCKHAATFDFRSEFHGDTAFPLDLFARCVTLILWRNSWRLPTAMPHEKSNSMLRTPACIPSVVHSCPSIPPLPGTLAQRRKLAEVHTAFAAGENTNRFVAHSLFGAPYVYIYIYTMRSASGSR